MSNEVIGVLDSGLGLVDFADALHTRLPAADLVLAMDPDFAPYGRLTPAQVRQRALASAAALASWEPAAIVVACNTASIHALEALRALYETGPGPRVPIIGTVPAIKVAAQQRAPFAVWATSATTGSQYQCRLIETFAADTGMDIAQVSQVACPGLSRAIDAADPDAIDRAILAGAAATPRQVENIVLGCTHYGLVSDRILKLRPQTKHLFDSPGAVAAQTARRLGLKAGAASAVDQKSGSTTAPGRIRATYMSGRLSPLPVAVSAYPAGRRLLEIVS